MGATEDLQVVPGRVQGRDDLGPLSVEVVEVRDDLIDLVLHIAPYDDGTEWDEIDCALRDSLSRDGQGMTSGHLVVGRTKLATNDPSEPS
jgi:hypothetical protein